MTITAVDITSEYKEIVDRLSVLEAEASELRKRRGELDSLAMGWMDEQGVEAIKGDGISLSRSVRRVYKVDDWEAMMAWAHGLGIFPFHKRITDTALAELEGQGVKLPECVMPQDIQQVRYRTA